MNEAVQLFLLEGGAEAVASGVTLQADGRELSGMASRPGNTKIDGVARPRRGCRTTAFETDVRRL